MKGTRHSEEQIIAILQDDHEVHQLISINDHAI
jgi:hypothetical protein